MNKNPSNNIIKNSNLTSMNTKPNKWHNAIL